MAVYKRGKLWVADFWVGGRDGRRVRRAAPTKRLAEAYVREGKTREFKGDLFTEIQPISFSRFIELYRELRESGNAESTQTCDNLVFKHLSEHLGDPLVQTISSSDIESYKATRLKKVKPVTVNLELRVLRSLLNRAVDWGYLRQSPFRTVKMLKVEQRPPDLPPSMYPHPELGCGC
jgi:hypothetical protein